MYTATPFKSKIIIFLSLSSNIIIYQSYLKILYKRILIINGKLKLTKRIFLLYTIYFKKTGKSNLTSFHKVITIWHKENSDLH